MTEKIQTKVFNYGDPCEASWPPQFGTNQGRGGVYHIDKTTGKLVDGPAPNEYPRHSSGPYVITDTIDAYKHPKNGEWTDSKSKLKRIDKETGTITTDKYQKPDPSWQKEQRRLRVEDGHKSLHKAVAQVDAGTAPLTEEVRARCDIENERISKALNWDAYNVAGRKKDPRGKRFRRNK